MWKSSRMTPRVALERDQDMEAAVVALLTSRPVRLLVQVRLRMLRQRPTPSQQVLSHGQGLQTPMLTSTRCHSLKEAPLPSPHLQRYQPIYSSVSKLTRIPIRSLRSTRRTCWSTVLQPWSTRLKSPRREIRHSTPSWCMWLSATHRWWSPMWWSPVIWQTTALSLSAAVRLRTLAKGLAVQYRAQMAPSVCLARLSRGQALRTWTQSCIRSTSQKAAVSRSWVQWLMVGRLMFASALRRTLIRIRSHRSILTLWRSRVPIRCCTRSWSSLRVRTRTRRSSCTSTHGMWR